MKKTLRLVAVLVVLVLASTLVFAACKPDSGSGPTPGTDTNGVVNNDFKVGGTVILGSTTQMGGDFRWTGLGQSSANAADQDIQGLTTGYSTMELNQGGSYVWNNTVVKSHNEEVIDAGEGVENLRITIEINSGLKMSGGTEVTAAHFLAYTLAMSTPVSLEALGYNLAGQAIAGYAEYSAYNGTNDGQAVSTRYGSVTASKKFAGLRLLDTYKFSIEIAGPDYYPYYYADTYGAISPEDLNLVLGEGVEVKDDGDGAYLSDAWYATTTEGEGEEAVTTYDKDAHLQASRYDYYTYEYTGPYTVDRWNATSSEVTLKINPNFAGNFEGQKPHVETIVYRLLVQSTQFAQLQAGEVDVIVGLTDGSDINQALSLVKTGNYGESHYDRAGYGKLQFNCDFSPTMFKEVRQAIAYSLDREDFANTFTQGFGSVVNGPYSVNFDSYVELQDELEANLNPYSVSAVKAAQVLEQGGWIYNADGSTPWDKSKSPVRYKKLAATEYGPNNINQSYKGVGEDQNLATVKIGNDYFMPLVINWMSTEDNAVSELLTTKLIEGTALTNLGMKITKTETNFVKLQGELSRIPDYGYGGTPTWSMYNLATGWNTAMYDYAYNWISNKDNEEMYDAYIDYSVNFLSDDEPLSWWDDENKGLTFDEAVAKAGGADKLGMNYISYAMVYSVDPGDVDEYNKWFYQYLIRWNELLPDIPLYSNIYYDCYNSKILNFKTSPFFGPSDAILYCAVSSAQ